MATRDILNYNGDVIGQLTLSDDATETQWTNALAQYAVQPSLVPEFVTPRQIRQALFMNGVNLSQIDTALASLPDPTKTMAQIEWEYSTLVYRTNPLVSEVGQMLGWTSDQIDVLFIAAANLPL